MQLVHSGGCSNTLLTNGAIFANTGTNIFIFIKFVDACTLPESVLVPVGLEYLPHKVSSRANEP